MTSAQRKQLYDELIDRLTAIYQHVRADLSAATVRGALSPDTTDEAEESAIDELEALEGDMEGRDRELAHAIEDALRRMSSDDYGVCIDCGREIPFGRLRAVPWTLRCEEDEERAERPEQFPTL
jgi:DnaK suppressor protein